VRARRGGVLGGGAGEPVFLGRAVAKSDKVPYGMDIEETVRELWNGD